MVSSYSSSAGISETLDAIKNDNVINTGEKDGETWRDRKKFWIQVLEDQLSASSPEMDPDYYMGKLTLAQLYYDIQQYGNAQSIYAELAEEMNIPGEDPRARMSSLYKAAELAPQAGVPVDRALEYLDTFETVYKESIGSEWERWGLPDKEYRTLDRFRAHLIEQYVKVGWDNEIRKYADDKSMFIKVVDEKYSETAAPLHAKASEYAVEYARSIISSGQQGMIKSDAMIYAAQVLADAAADYDKSGQLELGRKYHAAAVDWLERVFSEKISGQDTRLSLDQIASFLVHEEFGVIDNVSDAVVYAQNILDIIHPPATETRHYLLKQAEAMSSKAGVLELGAVLAGREYYRPFYFPKLGNHPGDANMLFDLLINKEKQWFPDEYRDHLSYQWALSDSINNDLVRGDLEDVQWRLEEYESLGDDLKPAIKETRRYDYRQYYDHLRNKSNGIKEEPVKESTEADSVQNEENDDEAVSITTTDESSPTKPIEEDHSSDVMNMSTDDTIAEETDSFYNSAEGDAEVAADSNSNTFILVAGSIAVLVLAGAGIFILSRKAA